MKDVSVTIRISEGSKEIWRKLADQDGMSLGDYLERAIMFIKDRDVPMDSSALDVLLDRLVIVSNNLDEMMCSVCIDEYEDYDDIVEMV